MELTRRQGQLLALAVLVAMAILLLARLSAFGILDPWELTTADQARDLAAGEGAQIEGPPLGRWLVAAGFALFGVSEWAGRLPIVLCGLLSLGATGWLVARFADWRAGAYAVVVAGTTPLFLLNARQMLGQSPAFLADALVGLTAASAVFLPTVDRAASAGRRARATLGWLLGLAGASVLAVLARGALLGLLPALGAVAVAAGLSGALTHPDPRRSGAAWAVVGAALVVALVVAQRVVADAAGYSPWLGGWPHGGDPPTFDVALEDAFHAFAPWSPLALPALGRMLVAHPSKDLGEAGAPAGGPEEPHLRRAIVLWAAFAYGALTLFLSRYGTATWVAIAPLAAGVALLLRDVERSGETWWPTAVVGALLVGLLIRDYGLFPGSPVEALPIERTEVPEEFNPITAWTAALGVFALVLVLALGSPPTTVRPRWRAPYDLLLTQWRRGWGTRAWLIAGGVLVAAILVLGLLAAMTRGGAATGVLPVTTLVSRVLQLAAAGVLLVPVLVAAGQGLLWVFGRLGGLRVLPLLLAGVGVGAYAAQGFLPNLSAHYSPRGVYDVYKELAEGDEPLGEYRVGSRAAAYYVEGELRELGNQNELLRFLTEGDGRRWAVIPADQLPAIDRQFRQRTDRHLFVGNAESARVVLVANRPVQDATNESFLAGAVLDEPPRVEHPVGANYANQIELVGYDMDLPHDGYVGAGESFDITWYWRVLDRVRGSWKIFVHIEGQGLRLIGDHEPVDGKYPVQLWEKGDVIVDHQELTVPAHYRPGTYQILVGFWRGDDRLEVLEGPQDQENRVRAGVLRIR